MSYAALYLQALADGSKRSDVVLAPRVGVDASTISRWRLIPEFVLWLTETCTTEHRGGLARLLVRSLELGIQGSNDHAKFYAEHSGESPRAHGGAGVGDNPAGVAVQFIGHVIPRPEPLPAPSLPASSFQLPTSKIPTVAVR